MDTGTTDKVVYGQRGGGNYYGFTTPPQAPSWGRTNPWGMNWTGVPNYTPGNYGTPWGYGWQNWNTPYPVTGYNWAGQTGWQPTYYPQQNVPYQWNYPGAGYYYGGWPTTTGYWGYTGTPWV